MFPMLPEGVTGAQRGEARCPAEPLWSLGALTRCVAPTKPCAPPITAFRSQCRPRRSLIRKSLCFTTQGAERCGDLPKATQEVGPEPRPL